MKNIYRLISGYQGIGIIDLDETAVIKKLETLYQFGDKVNGFLKEVQLYCNNKSILEYKNVGSPQYSSIVFEIIESIKVHENTVIDPFLASLKHIKTEIDSGGSRRLELNYNCIKYDYNSDIFILTRDNRPTALSKLIDYYNYLETYKDIYILLLDLGVDYQLLSEIFIVDGSERIDSLHEIRLYAKRTQESLRRCKSDFSSPEDVEFLGELRDNPIGYAIKHAKEKFEETLNNVSKLGTVGFSQGDTTKISHYKGLVYNEQTGTVIIELSEEMPVNGMNIF